MSPHKRIFLILLLLASTSCIRAQRFYVVSIGIADYKYINDLTYTEDDVNTFNQIMSQHNAEIVSLTGSQASHTNIIKAVRSVLAKATPSDAVIFFFSGHGYEGGFCCYDMRSNTQLGGISYKELQILFRNCQAGKKMVFADACFSGGLSKQRTQLQVQMVLDNDVMFFLSSKLDETSLEFPQGSNGLYTFFLAKGLCGEADTNKDLVITAKEIFNYVSVNVTTYADQISHTQHPIVWGNFDWNMSVLDWR